MARRSCSRASSSFASTSACAMRSTLPTRTKPRPLVSRITSRAWSQGTSTRRIVTLPFDLVAGDHVEVRDVRDQAQHVGDVDVLEVERDAAAGVLLAVEQAALVEDARSRRRSGRSRRSAGRPAVAARFGAWRCRRRERRSGALVAGGIGEHRRRARRRGRAKSTDQHGALARASSGDGPSRASPPPAPRRACASGCCEGRHQRDRPAARRARSASAASGSIDAAREADEDRSRSSGCVRRRYSIGVARRSRCPRARGPRWRVELDAAAPCASPPRRELRRTARRRRGRGVGRGRRRARRPAERDHEAVRDRHHAAPSKARGAAAVDHDAHLVVVAPTRTRCTCGAPTSTSSWRRRSARPGRSITSRSGSLEREGSRRRRRCRRRASRTSVPRVARACADASRNAGRRARRPPRPGSRARRSSARSAAFRDSRPRRHAGSARPVGRRASPRSRRRCASEISTRVIGSPGRSRWSASVTSSTSAVVHRRSGPRSPGATPARSTTMRSRIALPEGGEHGRLRPSRRHDGASPASRRDLATVGARRREPCCPPDRRGAAQSEDGPADAAATSRAPGAVRRFVAGIELTPPRSDESASRCPWSSPRPGSRRRSP